MAAARSRTSPTDDSGKLREMPRMSRGGRLAASLRLKVSAPLLHSIRLSVACTPDTADTGPFPRNWSTDRHCPSPEPTPD
jgi:hypothetical protein